MADTARDDEVEADEVYLSFLEQESADEAAFEALVERHHGIADELRRLHRAYPALEGAVARGRLGSLGVEPSAPRLAQWSREATEALSGRAPTTWPFDAGREIGRGAFGVVRAVRDEVLERSLAMKTLVAPRSDEPPEVDDRRLMRFLREARVLGRLGHPGIAPLHDVGLDPRGRPFFTMELIEGIDFREVVRRVRADDDAWSLRRAVDVLARVCETVAYAHDQGVVHRDLKPEHVRVGGFGAVYVMDWGLATWPGADGEGAAAASGAEAASSPSLTLEGTVIGTPEYMAPEQARGAIGADPRVDVYSLGSILYELLSGAPPYAGRASSSDVLARVVDGPPARLRPGRRAPRELIAVSERAMARDAAHRYPTASELAEDIRAFLDSRPGSVDGLVRRAGKFVRRHAGAIIIGVLAVSLAVIARSLDQQTKLASAHEAIARAVRRQWAEQSPEAAIPHYETAIDLVPSLEFPYAMLALLLPPGQLDALVDLADSKDASTADLFLNATFTAARAGALDVWSRLNEEAIRRHPGDPRLLYQMSRCLEIKGVELERRIDLLRRAVELEGLSTRQRVDALTNLGGYLQELAQSLPEGGEENAAINEESYARLVEAHELDPGHATVALNLGVSCLNLGKWEEGLRHLETAAVVGERERVLDLIAQILAVLPGEKLEPGRLESLTEQATQMISNLEAAALDG